MTVAIQRTRNLRGALALMFRELSFAPGKRVFVKPNLCGKEPVLPGENTSLDVMDALIGHLAEVGCDVVVGHGALMDNSGCGIPFEATLKASGFDKYAAMKGVRLVNLDTLERAATKGEFTFHLPMGFLEHEVDSYINLAKIKTHMETTVSLSVKNQMGLVSPPDRVMMHRTNLSRAIASLALAVKPTLSVLEGIPAMDGNGPHHGNPRNIGLIACGDDMLELDSFLCGLIGIDPSTVGHLTIGAEIGAGRFHQGDDQRLREFRVRDFLPASKAYRFGARVFAYPTFACSRCIEAIDCTRREIRRHPLRYRKFIWDAYFGGADRIVVFGKADDLDVPLRVGGTVVCVGSCAKTFAARHGAPCLDRCPPTSEETIEFLLRRRY